MTLTVSTANASLRSASMAMLNAYKADVNIRLQTYPGRPSKIFPPAAWPDAFRDIISFTGTASFMQHDPITAEIVVVHGLFDTAEAVAQRDAFTDGFTSWVRNNRDAFDPRGSIGRILVNDVPAYTPDWVPPEDQMTYYATQIVLEGWIED